jgi:hypothetical protein
MSDSMITRREAIHLGVHYFGLVLMALLSAAVPTAEPAMPDWLRDTPPWLLPKLERIIRASNVMTFENEYKGATIEGFWEQTAQVFETAARPRTGGAA